MKNLWRWQWNLLIRYEKNKHETKEGSWKTFDKLNIKRVNVTIIKALDKHFVSLRERMIGYINHDIHEAFDKLKRRGECDT